MGNIKILELFAGIGACSVALKRLGIDADIVDAVEIDKYAMASFNAIHGTNFEVQDIKEWDKDIKDVDLITHGSPCQDFSVAGKQAGGDLGSGTRSSLMYETIRIVGKIRPKYVLWENVKNLLSAKHKHNFDAYIETMNILGYNSYYQVLNAKDYGIPQNRERVYTISIRKDIDKGNFKFPEKEELKLRLKDVLEDEVDEKYYLSDKTIKTLLKYNENYKPTGLSPTLMTELANSTGKNVYSKLLREIYVAEAPKCIQIGTLDIKGHDSIKRVYDNKGLSPTLTDMQGGNRQPKIEENYRIRKLTPKECWRLMGFADNDFEKAAKVPTSNTQLYKQAGNSIVVNVLEKIFKNLLEE
jgi:DNA (cytosine-5)-methyltransferase 1